MNSPTQGTRKYNAFVKDGVITTKPLSWVADDGLRPTDEWLVREGYYGYVEAPAPAYDRKTQRVEQVPLSQTTPVNGVITQAWRVVGLNPTEMIQAEDEAWSELRYTRDQKLVASDWTQVSDAPVDKAAWASYRQKLRDMPNTTANPFNPNWPIAPKI